MSSNAGRLLNHDLPEVFYSDGLCIVYFRKIGILGPKHAVSTLNLMTPKRVTMFLNGPKPRRLMRLLLDERTTQSFLHVLDEITNFFSPLPGPIRKVFDVELGEVKS